MKRFQHNFIPDKSIPDINNIPESWFLPISELNSEKCKTYMDEEQRKKMLRDSLRVMLNEKKKQK